MRAIPDPSAASVGHARRRDPALIGSREHDLNLPRRAMNLGVNVACPEPDRP